jgi:hypothetical protein
MPNPDTASDLDEVRWAPRVPPRLIRRLYASEARGRLDEEILDEVRFWLYLRCQSILTIAEANQGRVKCPRCGRVFSIESRGGHILIFANGQPRRPDVTQRNHATGERLRCPQCCWSVTWEEYCGTWRGKKLNIGGAAPAIEQFVRGFQSAHSPRDKILHVDRLIHAFHVDLNRKPVRPVACNVIDGNLNDVVTLILELAYGDVTQPEMQRNHEAWQKHLPEWVRKHTGKDP